MIHSITLGNGSTVECDMGIVAYQSLATIVGEMLVAHKLANGIHLLRCHVLAVLESESPKIH